MMIPLLMIETAEETEALIDPALLIKVQEEAQVIVHCSIKGSFMSHSIRIWKTTYLIPHESDHRSELVHVNNITLFPAWMNIPHGKTTTFTLVFTALPKDCKVFDLLEIIPESGGFEFRNIRRNSTDVYHIHL